MICTRDQYLSDNSGMVIGFDASRAFIAGRTGTENYSYQLLKSLSEIDNRNKYIVYLRQIAVPGVNWPANFQFKKISWQRLWTQGGLARQTFADKLDVLFVPAHTIPIIRRPGLKTVVTVHDLGSEYLPGMHQVKQRFYLGFMQKVQLRSATKIIAVSEATKEDLVKKIGIDSKKIKVVYEGYDKKLFRPIRGDLLVNSLKRYDLQSGNYFLFVGTVQPRKNLERLIKAFSSFVIRHSSNLKKIRIAKNELQLVIAGSKGWLSDEIYKLPKKLGIDEKVKFLGYVSDQDLPALYSGAVALTFPSLFEGFGLPILEAQASGCPVLTSNISSMPEVAGPAAAGGSVLVDPYSVDGIVKGMERVKLEGERGKLIKAGFENIKRFSWEKCAKETLEVLENV